MHHMHNLHGRVFLDPLASIFLVYAKRGFSLNSSPRFPSARASRLLSCLALTLVTIVDIFDAIARWWHPHLRDSIEHLIK